MWHNIPVRAASWFLVLCTVLGGIAAFFPAMRLDVGGRLLGKHSEISLYRISNDREMVRSMLSAYRASHQRKLGDKVIHKVTSHLGNHLKGTKDTLEDIRDAMDTLDDLTDDDIKTAGTLYTIAFWALLGLQAAMLLLVFPAAVRGVAGRGRRVLTLVAALLVALLAAGFHFGCREAVWQINDEFGHRIMTLAPAIYLLPAMAALAFFASIALVSRRR